MQLHWTVVTYLLKNIEHGIKHDIDSTYGNIRLYVPEIYSRFDEQLSIEAEDEFAVC